MNVDLCSYRQLGDAIQTKMVEHKRVSSATIVRLCRLFQLYYFLCSGKTYQTCRYVAIAKVFCSKNVVPLTRALFIWKKNVTAVSQSPRFW